MMPNFLVIGAARSGTTSLYRYLGSHPEIYMSPVKEPNFFAQDEGRFDFGASAPGQRIRTRLSVFDSAKYEALFAGVTDEKAIGEASPSYLGSPGAAERIQRTIPAARLIAILRHPAERAYTNYMGRLRDGRESSLDPYEAIGGALRGESPPWRSEVYISQGFYHERLRPFYERFDRKQIQVCLFDDFVRDPRAVLRGLFSFLGVDPGFELSTSTVHNPSGRITNPLLRFAWVKSKPLGARLGTRVPSSIHAAVWRLIQRNLSRPPLPADLRAALIERYRPDVLALEKLLGRDLSNWLA
jgi:hypothetical protein